MQSEIIGVAILKEIVKEHSIALDRSNLETFSIRTPLGKSSLSPRIGMFLISEVEQKSDKSRLRCVVDSPVMMSIVFLAIYVVNDLPNGLRNPMCTS